MISIPSATRRSFLGGAGSLGLLSLTRSRQATAQETARLRIRYDRDPAILDPAFQTGGLEDVLQDACLLTLSRFAGDGSTTIVPYAADVALVDGGRVVEFQLKEGFTWSGDFGPVTSDDVAYSFERLIDPALDSPWSGDWVLLERVETDGPLRGRIVLKEPFAPILSVLCTYSGHIVCKRAVEEAGGSYDTTFPAVCGPYQVNAIDPQQRVRLGPNPTWTMSEVAFPDVDFILVSDIKSAELAFEAGELDITKIDIGSIRRYREDLPEGAKLIERPGQNYVWLGLNVEHPKLQDPLVRQAIQHAVNVDEILVATYEGLAVRATGTVPPDTLGHRDANRIAGADPERARQLLADAGVDDLSLTLTVINDTKFMTMAQVIQAQLAAAGITIDIRSLESGVFWIQGIEEEGDDWKDLQLALQRFGSGTDPYDYIQWLLPEQVGIWNWQRHNDKEMEDLYYSALVEPDPAERDRMYRRIQDIMEESGAYVFITHEPQALLYRDFIEIAVRPDLQPYLPTLGRV